MYTAIVPVPLSAVVGESTQGIATLFMKSYLGVCMEGAIIILSCIILSAFASSQLAIDSSSSAVSMEWTYVGEIIFIMLILVGTIKMSDRIVIEMMGL